MRWLPVLLVLVLSLTGCARHAPYTPDPFFGPVVIPPPPTGSANADPYYRPPLTPVSPGLAVRPPAPNASLAPRWTPPGDSGTSGSTPNTSSTTPNSSTSPTWPADRSSTSVPTSSPPPGSGTSLFGTRALPDSTRSSIRLAPPDYQNHSAAKSSSVALAAVGNRTWSDPVTIGADAPTTRPGAASSAAASAGSSAASKSTAVPSAVDSPRLMPEQPTVAPLRRTTSPPPSTTLRPVNIMDLPDAPTAGKATSSAALTSSLATTAPRATPAGEPVEAASFSAPARYGYDPQYTWLKGKLEYSEVDKRWKLRYIPIDGQPDQYGGSVVLGGYGPGKQFKPGDFAEVHGRLLTGATADWGYAPVFEVERAKALQ
ncbi:MAG: hypothetical protein JW818_07075 [Pirellulales bacterium]|nr:hypothetical protein [Pirellulales bacterium]